MLQDLTVRQQAITWANVDIDHVDVCRHMSLPGHTELNVNDINSLHYSHKWTSSCKALHNKSQVSAIFEHSEVL